MISTNWKISTKLELELNVSNAKIFAYFINFYSQNYSLYSSIYLQIIKLLRLLNYLIELLTQFECRSNILIAENLEFITRNCDNHFFFFFSNTILHHFCSDLHRWLIGHQIKFLGSANHLAIGECLLSKQKFCQSRHFHVLFFFISFFFNFFPINSFSPTHNYFLFLEISEKKHFSKEKINCK